jgi:hypothetical protein
MARPGEPSLVEVLRDHIATLRRMRDNAREAGNDERARRLDATLADYEAYLASFLREHPE